jgi:lipid II:glycine glycyltransferase (peptidoglycan interpeptide bridge formation enzyme)
MVTDSRLKLPGKVSARLFSAIPKIQDMFCLWGRGHWDTNFEHVPVDVEVRSKGAKRGSGVACFFSGGLDSFYTLLKNLDEVTHLIFVRGFDINLANQALRMRASQAGREVARELGKTLIEVETNLRSFSDPLVNWDQYHGAALASVGLLFQHLFRKILIPSSFTYSELFPWGTHPLLDPLWSTELTRFEHDGCEATRTDKAGYVSKYETAMKWLRVCWNNPKNAYNCGRCEKCQLTMANLHAAGALGRCRTLPDVLSLDTKAVGGVRPPVDNVLALTQQDINTPELRGPEEPSTFSPDRAYRPAQNLKERVLKTLGMSKVVQRAEPGIELKEVYNPAQWDAAVKALGGSITQSWRWGLFEQRAGWKPLRLLDEEGRGAVQLFFKDLNGGFSVAYAPYGPLAATTSDLVEVLASAARWARQRRAHLLKVEPRWGVEANREVLAAGSYLRADKELPGCTIIVDIPKEPEEHLKSLPKDTRYGIRLAHRNGVEVATLYRGAEHMSQGLTEFYKLLQETSRRQGFDIGPRSFYQNLIVDLPAYLLLARYKGTAVAGAIIATFGDEAYYFYGASSAEKGNLYAPYLVQWEAMDVARRAGCSRYDMWGIPCPPYSSSLGYYQFKKKFAGTHIEYAKASILVLSYLELYAHSAIVLGTRGRYALRKLGSRVAGSKILQG